MSISGRLIILAAFGFLFLGNGQAAKHFDTTEKREAPYEAPSDGEIRDVVSPEPYEYRCDKPRDEGEVSACATAAQANAAQTSNNIGRDSLWLNKIGIGAVVATLLATAWAAFAASRAARAASLSLDHYRDAERADLVPHYGFNLPHSVHVTLINVGRTRAHVVYADMGLIPDGKVAPLVFSIDAHPGNVVVKPDAIYDFGSKGFQDAQGVVVGGAIYKDIFGRVYLTSFSFAYDLEAGRVAWDHKVDFRKWRKAAARLQRRRWWHRFTKIEF